jgi:8-oxo-dGTP pyrophosphatase MutT (NUDIX family)
MTRFASVALVDRRGWVLLQERDEHAVIAPERWGLAGGHVEPGETMLAAAVRELAEETGIALAPGELHLIGEYDVHHVETDSDDTLAFYAAPTTLADADVVVGEGRQIVFVDPVVVPTLPLTDSARQILLPFLASARYARMCS